MARYPRYTERWYGGGAELVPTARTIGQLSAGTMGNARRNKTGKQPPRRILRATGPPSATAAGSCGWGAWRVGRCFALRYW